MNEDVMRCLHNAGQLFMLSCYFDGFMKRFQIFQQDNIPLQVNCYDPAVQAIVKQDIQDIFNNNAAIFSKRATELCSLLGKKRVKCNHIIFSVKNDFCTISFRTWNNAGENILLSSSISAVSMSKWDLASLGQQGLASGRDTSIHTC